MNPFTVLCRVIPVLSTLGLAACSAEQVPLGAVFDRHHEAGARELLEVEQFERIDLVRLLDPDGQSADLEKAFAGFYTQGTDDQERARRRDRVQDRIMAASEQRCGAYKVFLRRFDSQTDFFFGALTTTLGGLGAIFTDATVARSLAGAAGITSGINAEKDAAFLASQAVSVITKGIDARRDEIRGEIAATRTAGANGTPVGVDRYTVEAAVGDAVRFHNACTINAGLEQAEESITQAGQPGADRIKQMLKDVEEMRTLLDKAARPRVEAGETPSGGVPQLPVDRGDLPPAN